MTTDYKRESKQRNPAKLARSVAFEHKLGVAAYRDPRSLAAADAMIDSLTRAVLPAFDQASQRQQAKYAAVFGRDDQAGAWSAGQVGNDFATVMAATTTGNLRERMTAIYNASLGSFKTEVLSLIELKDWDTADARGLDTTKLKRRKRQMTFNPGARDLYREPRNPIDRKHLSTYTNVGNPRIENHGAARQSQRTVGDLTADGIALSDREKQFMYKKTNVRANKQVRWEEGGTRYRIDPTNKWVKQVQNKLHMPVVASPSGTALRLFQAWEFLSRPAVKEDFRLALLGWMLTCNDHSFHELMMTSAEYGMRYEPGLAAYRDVAPFTEDELRVIAGPNGFPDEENYIADHMAPGAQNSILATDDQLQRFNQVIASGANIWAAGAPPQGGELAHAMAVLVYTDEGAGGNGVSAYKFMNNVLKNQDSAIRMLFYINSDPDLKAAYEANKFNIKQLVTEAKQHADYMQKGLLLLRPYTRHTYRGYKSMTLPKAGESWTAQKFFSSAKRKSSAKPFMDKGFGTYRILAKISSVAGRDIGGLSMFPGESEVIFPSGSTFSIAGAPQKHGDDSYRVDWTNHG